MTFPRLILFPLLVLGCVITLSSSMPQHARKRVKRTIESIEASAEAKRQEGAGDGTPEGIEKNPDNARSYVNWGNSNFNGVQNIMDGHFMKKKKEGDQVTKYGDKTRKEGEIMQTKIEKSQFGTMSDTFKFTHDEMVSAIKDMAKARERSGEYQGSPGGDDGGSGSGSSSSRRGSVPPPPPRAPPPPPSAGSDESEAGVKNKKKKGKSSSEHDKVAVKKGARTMEDGSKK